MSARSPLPYIIGSEEYNHDDSCGLVTGNEWLWPNLPI